jgi:hypothetical protein
MKVQIIHDKKGEILSVSQPSEHRKYSSGIIAGKGQLLTEIETGEIKKFDEEHIMRVVQNFIVDKKPSAAKLVPKKRKDNKKGE